MIPFLLRAVVTGAAKSAKPSGKQIKAGVDIRGVEDVQRDLEKLREKFSRDVVQAAIASGQLVRTDAIESIQDESMGTWVKRYRADGKEYDHVASKPGDAPNTDTGRLVASIQVEHTDKTVYVGSNLDYAQGLEFGTRTMEARPWLNPALEKNREKIEEIFGKRLADRIKLENRT